MSAVATTYQVTAYNYAFDSDNKIHSDDVAARYGFKGGLVPGVADIAYLARAVYDTWGEDWLHGGSIETKLIKPIYHEESARACARPEPGGDALVLELLNPEGVVCAAGRAGLADARPAPSVAEFPRVEPPAVADRAPPSIEGFPPGTVLGAYEYVFERAAVAASATEMFVEPWPSADGWHPATCLHDANRILRANVALGPWIHTGSRLELHDAPAEGELVSLRGKVRDTFEKRGHVMTIADLALFADQRPIARIEHRAIIRLAGST